jgi:hypothetical protein
VTWVSWRLQRTETAIAAGVLALISALLIPTGLTIAHAYKHDGLGACLALNPSESCNLKIQAFQSHFQTLFDLTNWFTLAPGLIGVALAAPFIFEFEHGTYRLAWTQSITRGRWIMGKLGLAIACALIAAGALIALATWWRAPYVHLNGRLDTGTYDSEGTVVFGYTLFALGLTLALGVVWRRAAAALTVAFVGYFVARIFVDTWLRNRLVSPLRTTWKGADNQPAILHHANIISQQVVGRFPGGIGPHGGKLGIRPSEAASLVFHATYQPASHFWPLQLAETGVFAGVAVALILFAAWWTHQRTA